MQNKTYKILLLSGGADSMLLAQENRYDEYIFFSYGQNHEKLEFEKCQHLITKKIELPSFTKRDKEVNCRNMTFISVLVSIYGNKPLEIHVGTNQEDVYDDNSRDFYDKLETLLSSISFHSVAIKTPLIKMKKSDILKKIKVNYYTDL